MEILVQRPRRARARASRISAGLAFATAVVPVFVLAAARAAGVAGGALIEALTYAPLLTAALAVGSYATRRGVPFAPQGQLERDGDLIWVCGRSLPAASVEGAVIVPGARTTAVELELTGGDILAVEVQDVATAEALLQEIGVDASKRRCRVQVTDRGAARVVWVIAPVMITLVLWRCGAMNVMGQGATDEAARVILFGWYACVAALLRLLLEAPDVVVGLDGVSFRRWFVRRFVPLSSVADVRAETSGARIIRDDGSNALLFSLVGVSQGRVDALRLRVREAQAARSASAAAALEALDRGGRTVSEWRAALGAGAVAVRGSGYRAAGLSAEDLESVLMSPGASVERRLGAAVALAANRGPAAATSIRRAADGCASDRVRVALESVSNGAEDDDAIAEALAEETAALRRRPSLR